MDKSKLKQMLKSLQITIATRDPVQAICPKCIVEESFYDTYQIIEKLGEGAHSVVYKVMLKQTKIIFAAKQFRTNDEEMISIIKRTYSIQLMTNDSDFFLKTYDLFIDSVNGEHFLVSEYSELKTLEESIEQNLPVQKQMIIIRNLAEATKYLHNKRICHRDIKPDNILVDTTTGDIKLIDFGVAKIFKKNESNMMTPTGNIRYRAPEVTDSSTYDESIDVWSLGIVALQMSLGIKQIAETISLDSLKGLNYGKYLLEMMLEPNPKLRANAAQIVQILSRDKNLQENQQESGLILKNGGSNRSLSFESPKQNTETKTATKIKIQNSHIHSYKFIDSQKSPSKRSLQSKIKTNTQQYSPLPVQLVSSIGTQKQDIRIHSK